MPKVFSITDFKEGLDVRKTPLTAPGGSLRIMTNAVINQGGEIEKRLAFVKVTTLPPEVGYIFGQGGVVHVWGVNVTPSVPQGTCPVAIVPHMLTFPGPETITEIIDVEAFNNGFYVSAMGSSGATYVFWNGVLLTEVGGGASHGTFSRTYKTKMYRVDGKYLRFAGVNDPSVNDPANTTSPGAGFINVATNDPDGEDAVSMEVYYNWMAVFSRMMVQMWTLDPDPDKDTLGQILRIGTVASHSVLQFGSGDVLFLTDSGVRSLKALSVSLAATVSDVGSAIDPLLTDAIRDLPSQSHRARAVVQPIQGRYWLAIGSTVYVLSFFPSGKVTAWSTFTLTFSVKEWAAADNRIFCRGDDQGLYLYGGVDFQTYDSCRVTIRTPHHAVEGPTERKRIKSCDVMCVGAWSLSLGMLPNNTEAFELVANISNNTFGIGSIPFAGWGTHLGAHLVNEAPGPAVLASLHFNVEGLDTK